MTTKAFGLAIVLVIGLMMSTCMAQEEESQAMGASESMGFPSAPANVIGELAWVCSVKTGTATLNLPAEQEKTVPGFVEVTLNHGCTLQGKLDTLTGKLERPGFMGPGVPLTNPLNFGVNPHALAVIGKTNVVVSDALGSVGPTQTLTLDGKFKQVVAYPGDAAGTYKGNLVISCVSAT